MRLRRAVKRMTLSVQVTIVYGENDDVRAPHESGENSRLKWPLTRRCHAIPVGLSDNGAYCALPAGILQRIASGRLGWAGLGWLGLALRNDGTGIRGNWIAPRL